MKAVLSVLSVFVISVLGVCFADPTCNGLIRTACENLYTAQRCGRVPECLRVWKESRWGRYQTDVSADCTFCLHLASLSKSERSGSLLCGTRPSNTSNIRSPLFDADTCVAVATRLTDASSGKDGIALCNVLTHCRSHTYIGNLNFGSTVCDDCKKIVGDIRELLSDNATSDAITKKLNALICTNIPGQFQDICQQTIKAHVRPILDLINRHISPQDICSLLELCPRSDNMLARLSDLLSPTLFAEEAVRLPPATHVECPKETKFSWVSRPSARGHPKWTSLSRLGGILPTLTDKPSGSQCEAVLNQIRISLKDPEQQAKIKEDIDKEVCTTLPSFLRTMCENAVNEHFNEMMEHLDKVDLKQICAAFGMPPDSLHTPETPAPPTASFPVVCQVCEIVMGKLVDMVMKGATEKQITEALDQVCRIVPKSYEANCDKFVKEYGGKIVAALITGTAPELICMTLGLCTPIAPVPVVMTPPVRPIGDTYCDTCKLLVTMVEHQLVQNETEEQVEQLLKNMCAVLPSSYVEECKSLIDKYLPTVMEYLTKQMSPEQVCEAIQLCSSRHRLHHCLRGPAYWCSSQAAAVRCKAETYCKHTFRTLEAETSAEQKCETEDLDKICGSSELAAKCGKSNECLNRRMVQYLHLVTQHTQEALKSPKLNQNCTVCTQLVTRWRLHKTLFGAPIVNEDTCVVYSKKADRDQCKLVVKNSFNIFQLLVRKATDAEAICKSLALCQMEMSEFSLSSPVVENLAEIVGAQSLACSEGPVFWCASKRNAEACGTVNFCNALSWFGEKDTKSKPTTLLEVDVDVFGVNACAWGAVYWCQNEETARRCGALNHCQTVVWRSDRPADRVEIQQVKLNRPSNPCSWGPSYYCSSPEKAVECGEKYVERCWQLARQRNRS